MRSGHDGAGRRLSNKALQPGLSLACALASAAEAGTFGETTETSARLMQFEAQMLRETSEVIVGREDRDAAPQGNRAQQEVRV